MKMVYSKPCAEIIQFDNEDVITASGTNTCPFNPGFWCEDARCGRRNGSNGCDRSAGWCDDECWHENSGHWDCWIFGGTTVSNNAQGRQSTINPGIGMYNDWRFDDDQYD